MTAIETLVPRVEVVEPGLAYVPVAGAVRYYGGEEALVEAITNAIPPGGRLGVADGPFAARWAAERAGEGAAFLVEDTGRFLASLEVGTLGSEELTETLRWLGITTLGSLAQLPRPVVASRFGTVGLLAHRLAAGEDRTPLPRPIPVEMAVETLTPDDPILTADQVAFTAKTLAVELLGGLAKEGIGCFRVVVEVEAADGTVRSRVWSTVDPFTEHALTERVWWQVRAWMDAPGGVTGGVARLRLDPSDLSDEGRQLPLLEQVGSNWQEVDASRHLTDRALARAQALVGPDSVLEAVRRGGRMPGDQVRWYPWGETPPSSEPVTAPWPGQLPPPAPALVSANPPLLDLEWDGGMPVRVRLGARWEPVLSWSGPWRMTGRWWQGETDADLYQIVTSVGAVLCVIRDGLAYLAAVYD